MPKALHDKLKRQARGRFGATTSPAAKRFIYGSLNKARNNPGFHGPPVVVGKIRNGFIKRPSGRR